MEITNTKNYHGEKYRSNFPHMFKKRAIPKNFAKFRVLHLCRGFCFNKLDCCIPVILSKGDSNTGISCNFRVNFQNSFFLNTCRNKYFYNEFSAFLIKALEYTNYFHIGKLHQKTPKYVI